MNHFQSRSCSKSQILIDWVTYRYFFWNSLFPRVQELLPYFQIRSYALSWIRTGPRYFHVSTQNKSHGIQIPTWNKSFQCVWKIDAANSALLRSFFHLRSIFTSFHANHANHATLRYETQVESSKSKVEQKWHKSDKRTRNPHFQTTFEVLDKQQK